MLAFSAVSCTNKELQEQFEADGVNIGLTYYGETIFKYTDGLCQLGYDASKNEFRVSDDAMNDYYVVRLDKMPSVGEESTGTLIYTTDSDIVTKTGLRFKHLKSDGDKMWLWNRKNAIGCVVWKIQ